MDKIEVELVMNRITGMIIEEEILEGNVRTYHNLGRYNCRGGCRGNYRNVN